MRRPSHPLFLALAAASLAVGCARELELPAQPAPPRAEEPRPRLLGERAGLYQAWTLARNEYRQEQWVSVGPRLPILHVENPSGEPVDLLVAQLQPLLLAGEPERPGGFVEESCETGAGDALDGPMLAFGFYEPVSGTVELQLDEESGIAASGGTLAAGGLSLQVPFCGDDRLFPVVLRPVCPLQPALSGVYAGEWDDGGAARTTDVAVGISGKNLLLVEWPQGGIAALGSSGLFGLGVFDPNTEGGLFFGFRAGAAASLSAVCGGIALRRTVDEVALALRTYSGANPDSFDCPAFTEESPEAVEAFDGTRLAGSGDAACSADEGALPLVSTARLRRCGGRDVLDLRVTREGALFALDADAPQIAGEPPRSVEELLADGLFVGAEATDGETELRRLDASRAWPPVTARFELPAGRSRILVRAFVRDYASGSAGSTLPLCPAIGR